MNTLRAEIAHLHAADLHREAEQARRAGSSRGRRTAESGCSPLCRAAALHRARTT